jgi:hypothetical protein
MTRDMTMEEVTFQLILISLTSFQLRVYLSFAYLYPAR